MKKFINNKKGYVATMGALISLILISIIILYLFNISKKQQNSIDILKDNIVNTKINDRNSFERIAGLFYQDLDFGLDSNNNYEFFNNGVLTFNDLDKEFKLEDVSSEFGVKNIDVSIESFDNEVNIRINSPTKLVVESDLTDMYYETLLDGKEGDLELYGAHTIDVYADEVNISAEAEIKSDDIETSNKLTFEKEVIQPGNYEIIPTLMASEASISRNVPYSTSARIQTKISYQLTNRLVKITDKDSNRVYYLKIEDNTNPNDLTPNVEDNILIYLLDKEDLSNLLENK